MKNVRLLLATVVAGPVLALGLAGCGAGGAISKITNPTVDLPAAQIDTSGQVPATIATSKAVSTPVVAGVISASTEQTVASKLSQNNATVTSITPSLSVQIGGAAGRAQGLSTGIHVGVVLTSQTSVAQDQFWTLAESTSPVQNALGGELVFPGQGSYYFGPQASATPQGQIYGGDLTQPSSIVAHGIGYSGFLNGDTSSLASAYQALIQRGAANNTPINAFVSSYSDLSGASGSVQVTSLAVSGQVQAHL